MREALRLLELDSSRYGQATWNPLGEIIRPGDRVLLKPNLICAKPLSGDDRDQVITHGSIIRAVLDYVSIALAGQGHVIIADGPQTDSDFEAIEARSGLDVICDDCRARGLDVRTLDLRRDRWFQKGEIIYRRTKVEGDPAGYTTVDLADASEFATYGLSGRFYGADYDTRETAKFHGNGRHAYVLCRSALDADVVINLPKLKTHKKTGVTLSLKNLVGVNGLRNCLPHYTMGTPAEGGDEYPASDLSRAVETRAVRLFKRMLATRGGTGGGLARVVKKLGRSIFGETDRVARAGNWHGNDTIWRTVLDLNKVLFYFDGQGAPRTTPVRYLSLVDGIVGGQGNGPVSPEAVASGVVVAGFNPVAVDSVCAAIMGFDPQRIPMLRQAWSAERLPLAGFRAADIECRSNRREWHGEFALVLAAPHLSFAPHFGWRGTLERDTSVATVESASALR